MEYVTLNNGVKMPMAGIGTFLLSPDEAEASVLSALQCGYRLIDTANAYVNEKAVGRAMKRSGLKREEIFLETKLWPSFYEQDDAVDKTLARLDTDYIDLLLIHQPAGNYVAGYRQMEKAYKEGKVRAVGLSNFNEAQIREILEICEVKPSVLQTEVHPYSQEKALKQFLAQEGMVIQAWYPLGHGDKALINEPLFIELAQKYGKSNAQIILRWHIQDGNIVIPGSKNADHIRDNFDLFDFSLSDEEMAKIAAMDQKKRYYTSTPEMLDRYVQGFHRKLCRCGTCDPCGYVGMVSANSEPDKLEKSGFHAVKSTKVDAPLIAELPVTLECTLMKVNEDGNIIGKIENVSVDEAVLDEKGTIDFTKFHPIAFEPAKNGYHVLGERVGNAFSDGSKLK